MKKILFVCDEHHYPQGAFEWIRELRKQEHLSVKGLFFKAPAITTATRHPAAGKEDLPHFSNQDTAQFMDQCRNSDISSHTVEKSNTEWQKAFWKHESRYADLLIFSQALLYAGTAAHQPNGYMQQLLRWANCPVLAVPENTGAPEQLLVAYDGSPQSMHALKQCCLLFPQYGQLPVRIAYVKEEDSDHIPQLQLLTEYAHAHFTDVKILKLHWDSDKHFSTWVECFRNPLLITGAFGRSALSTSFKESFVTKIITDHVAPVFIAH
ncbi:universal stress protein [Niabella pedocola]|uniref:Universal stress protein n=1 Tax=Niabella pedocola TaxID=1752077 RepID=A0ABS8PKG5_9BACT|nr:universal stress protein [Niabella pedocola]MCD2421588.1 universal stress protein [Niabella pedocola]